MIYKKKKLKTIAGIVIVTIISFCTFFFLVGYSSFINAKTTWQKVLPVLASVIVALSSSLPPYIIDRYCRRKQNDLRNRYED
jgi:divalent metal cation (Fe/Co/Zn/Cd) transporter